MGWFILAIVITIGIVVFLCSDVGLNCLALTGFGCMLVFIACIVLFFVLIGFGCAAAMVASV